MFKLFVLLLLVVGAIAWMIRRAKRCSSYGCGVVELGEKPSSHHLLHLPKADLRTAQGRSGQQQVVGSPRA